MLVRTQPSLTNRTMCDIECYTVQNGTQGKLTWNDAIFLTTKKKSLNTKELCTNRRTTSAGPKLFIIFFSNAYSDIAMPC